MILKSLPTTLKKLHDSLCVVDDIETALISWSRQERGFIYSRDLLEDHQASGASLSPGYITMNKAAKHWVLGRVGKVAKTLVLPPCIPHFKRSESWRNNQWKFFSSLPPELYSCVIFPTWYLICRTVSSTLPWDTESVNRVSLSGVQK